MLKNLRIEAGLTQKEVAKKMNTTQEQVSHMESGEGNLAMNMMERFAFACGKTLSIDGTSIDL